MAKNFIKDRKNEKNNGAAGDDRNLVLVDDDFQDADFEDKVWLLWKRHGVKIVSVALLIFFSILGVIIYTQGKKMHVQALQEEYAGAKTTEERLAFAEANRSDSMAGTVFYELANEAFSNAKYDVAAQRYAEAVSVFSALSGEEFVIIRDRAAISEALALSKAGKIDEAKLRFTSLAETLTTDETIRGQAMFNLAVLALSAKDLPLARKWLDEMDRALSPLNMWLREKTNLIGLAPELVSVADAKNMTVETSATK